MGSQQVGEWLSSLRDAALSVGWTGLLGWLGLAVVIVVAVRLVRRWIDREVEDVNRRHALRKAAGYTGGAVVLIAGLSLLVGRVGQLATILGLIGAGLAIALQDLGKSVAGWIFLTTRSGFGPGTRTEVDGIEGEVIDIGLLKTTVLEVGNRVHGRQSSGRLATVPNSRFLNESSFFSPSYSPYTWQELRFLLTYESDWRRAAELLEEIAHEEGGADEEAVDRAFEELERRYAFKMGHRTPIVYVTAEDSGVQITLRHLSHVRERRGVRDRITRSMIDAVERDPNLSFAYPTTRFYRRGEGRDPDGGSGGPAGH